MSTIEFHVLLYLFGLGGQEIVAETHLPGQVCLPADHWLNASFLFLRSFIISEFCSFARGPGFNSRTNPQLCYDPLRNIRQHNITFKEFNATVTG